MESHNPSGLQHAGLYISLNQCSLEPGPGTSLVSVIVSRQMNQRQVDLAHLNPGSGMPVRWHLQTPIPPAPAVPPPMTLEPLLID